MAGAPDVKTRPRSLSPIREKRESVGAREELAAEAGPKRSRRRRRAGTSRMPRAMSVAQSGGTNYTHISRSRILPTPRSGTEDEGLLFTHVKAQDAPVKVETTTNKLDHTIPQSQLTVVDLDLTTLPDIKQTNKVKKDERNSSTSAEKVTSIPSSGVNEILKGLGMIGNVPDMMYM